MPDRLAAGPIVVGGFYRSGTSVVRRVLDGHSRIHCKTETKFWMDLFGTYRDDPLSHLRLFNTLRSIGAETADLVEPFGRAYIEVLNTLTDRAGKSRWADKAPENVLHLAEWEQLLGPAFPFVHCVRDPLDALASAREAGFARTLPSDFGALVEVLAAFLAAGLAREASHPDHTVRVRYEDLVADPRAVVTRLLESLGEPFEEGVLDLARDRPPGALEDPKVADQPRIHTHSIGRWRTDLATEEVALAQDRLRGPAVALGYGW